MVTIQPPRKTIVVLSGGLDSTTLLYHLRSEGHVLKALSVNYGQRHSRELQAATRICARANVDHRVIDLSGLTDILGDNALTNDSVDVPHGQYTPSTMATTTVPNRNMLLISVATSWAIASKFNTVAFGAHGGEYTPYPDCQPEFAQAIDLVTRVCDFTPITVLAPFVHWDKADIVKRGYDLGVPFDLTWSCYEGGEAHCGKCATCNDRVAAFRKNGLKDPVQYAD